MEGQSQMPAVAFDSKEYHAGVMTPFFAPIGLGVETRDVGRFKASYDAAMDVALSGRKPARRRKAHSFETLVDFYGENASKIADKFLGLILGEVSHVWFFHTEVSAAKTPFIYSQGKHKALPPLDYMKLHNQSYPYWCAWLWARENEPRSCAILLDAFQGAETNAWNELKLHRPLVFYKGDEVNPLISTADILLARADSALRQRILRDSVIEKVLGGMGFDATSMFIGQPHYHDITEISPLPINIRDYIYHPMVFMLHEDRPRGTDWKEWDRQRFLAEVTDTPVNYAFENNTGFKTFDMDSDGTLLNPRKDVNFYYGPDGKRNKEKLKVLYRMDDDNFREIA